MGCMEIPSSLVSLFTATIGEQNGDYFVSISNQQVQDGAIDPNKRYRIALIEVDDASSSGLQQHRSDQESNYVRSGTSSSPSGQTPQVTDGEPPVSEGDELTVTVESLGDQGDGIAYVEGGYVVVVEDGEVGEQLTVQIDTVKQNYAFAKIVHASDQSDPVSV